MGSQLARLALLPRADLGLSHPARLVLARMALDARDHDAEPIYFGGWPVLAMAMGRDGYTLADKRSVARAVAELVEAKLITLKRGGAHGRNATYALHLNPWD